MSLQKQRDIIWEVWQMWSSQMFSHDMGGSWCTFKVWLAKHGPSGYWLYAQGHSHSKPHCTDTLGESGHCINRTFHISEKFCIYFLCFSPSKTLLHFLQWETAFSQFCSNLRLSRRSHLASSPSARASLCMPSLQQTLPFLQPQQVGWAVAFQGRKGLTKSVLRELLEFCFGHWSKSQHNIWPER